MNAMRMVGGWAVGLMLMVPNFASAAWDNVFQLTCCGTPRVAQKPCCPQPAPCCPQTAYVQRSYYQPVTAYKPVAHLEPVTSYRTSYYYEPVTTYSYSLSVDPCTGCAQQVASPCTSYSLKSRCDAVTSYVQRISYQPVTAYRQSFYMEPVQVTPPCCPTSVAAAPIMSVQPPVPATINQIEHTAPPPSVTPPLNLGPDNRSMPQTTEKTITPSTSNQRNPQPVMVRPDQIAAGSTVTGTVVRNDYRPLSNAKVRFVKANGSELQPVQADGTGKFQIRLAVGSYKIYTEDQNGRATYHSDFLVNGADRNVTVVSR